MYCIWYIYTCVYVYIYVYTLYAYNVYIYIYTLYIYIYTLYIYVYTLLYIYIHTQYIYIYIMYTYTIYIYIHTQYIYIHTYVHILSDYIYIYTHCMHITYNHAMRALQLTVCGVASADAGAAVKKCSNEGANHKCCAKIFHRTVIALAASCLLVFIGAPSSCVYVCASFPSVRDLGKSQIFKIISISKPYSCLLSNLKPKPLWSLWPIQCV